MRTNNVEKWVTTCDLSERKVWIVPVINPDGVIKYPRVSPLIGSSLIEAVYDDRDPMHPRLHDVQLKPGLVNKGWVLVADDYCENNLAIGWFTFQKWMRTTPMMGATEAVKPFPTKYLPPGVAERIAGAGRHQFEEDEIVIPEMDDRPAPTSKIKRTRAGMD